MFVDTVRSGTFLIQFKLLIGLYIADIVQLIYNHNAVSSVQLPIGENSEEKVRRQPRNTRVHCESGH